MAINKKWLIGCGGCLGIILVAVIVVVGGSFWFVNDLTTKASAVTEDIFGGQLPPNYSSFMGMPFEIDGREVSVSLLNNTVNNDVLFALNVPLDGNAIQILDNGSEGEIEALIQGMLTEGASSGRSDVTVKEVISWSYDNQNIQLMKLMVVSKGKVMPMAAAIMPTGDESAKILALMMGNVTADEASDLDSLYDVQVDGLKDIISDSGFTTVTPAVVQ